MFVRGFEVGFIPVRPSALPVRDRQSNGSERLDLDRTGRLAHSTLARGRAEDAKRLDRDARGRLSFPIARMRAISRGTIVHAGTRQHFAVRERESRETVGNITTEEKSIRPRFLDAPRLATSQARKSPTGSLLADKTCRDEGMLACRQRCAGRLESWESSLQPGRDVHTRAQMGQASTAQLE